MSDFLANLKGPLDHVIAELPTDIAELRVLCKELYDKIQAGRASGKKTSITDTEKLIGVMHLLGKEKQRLIKIGAWVE